ncbi:MAG: hemolysin III family protein [Oligoflexia bacterium]|nr:hemolysin III family protein [Oligoflexia bacterium]
MNENIFTYKPKEEFFHTLSHGLGLFLAITGGIFLLFFTIQSGKILNISGSIIYIIPLILLYTSSTFYHGSKNPSIKKKFKLFDHLAIYLFICGTYAPFCFTLFPRPQGIIIFSIVMTSSVLGTIYELFFIGKSKIISSIIYVVTGIPAIFIIKSIWTLSSAQLFSCIILGGIAYVIGVIFYVSKKIPYNHVIWHIFVLIGSVFHFVAVFLQLGME